MGKKRLFGNVLLLSFLFTFSTLLNAQYSASNPVVMQKVTAELQKRGLNETEVRARLLKEGINVDALTAADASQYQNKIITILDQMQAEKKKQNSNNTQSNTSSYSGNFSEDNDSITNNQQYSNKNPRFTKGPNDNDFLPGQEPKDTSNIYGHSLFFDKTFHLLTTTDGAQVPDTYVLSEGDEIHITIFGASQTDIQQRISSEGSIQPVGAAKLFLKGLSLSQARELIKRQLSSAYLFRGDQIAISVVKVRTILVNVFGEVQKSGGYNISALNSALNVLSAAGGPTNIGSVRNIQLIRDNSRRSIDLYAFMNDPGLKQKFDLHNNDIVFVPVVQNLVVIKGAVKRPMTYEMLPNETLTELVNYAGGVKMNAYPDFIQVKRSADGEQRLLEYNLRDIIAGTQKVKLMNGDTVFVKSVNKPMEQYVEIEGSVYYPGQYDLSANATLTALINNAKPGYQAKTDMLFVERMRPDSTIEVISAPFPGAGVPEFKLQARDKVTIMNQATYRDVFTISVSGEVHQPFTKKFGMNDRLTVGQAINLAGGLKTSVYPVAYIFRKNIFNPVEMKYIPVDLATSDHVFLQPGDQLNVYDNSTYTNIGELRISGAVKEAKKFTFDQSMTVRDLITNAGGFALGAAFNRVEVFRMYLSPVSRPKLKLITLEVDSAYNVVRPANFRLQPFDQVVIRMVPEFTTGRSVEINGEVNYPGPYVLESRQVRLTDVIKMAGGLLPTADPNGTTLFRTYKERGNISFNLKKAMASPNNIKKNPIVFDGDIINIAIMENTVTILGRGTRMDQYSHKQQQQQLNDSLLYSDSTEYLSDSILYKEDSTSYKIKNVVFQGRANAAWYIKNYAGGFQKEADRNSVTVTYANNQMQSTRRFLFFKFYPIVEAGSTISVQMKPPKEKMAESKKFDYDATVSKTLNTVTTVMSLYIMAKTLGVSL
jgi:protein involved in polysaccharide export with SLBB domain